MMKEGEERKEGARERKKSGRRKEALSRGGGGNETGQGKAAENRSGIKIY